MSLLPGLEILERETVIGIAGRFPADIDQRPGRNQLADWNLVGAFAALGKMDRRVEVGTAVLGRAEGVRRVEVSARGLAVRQLRQFEIRGRGRPIDRFLIERMAQVDHPGSSEVQWLPCRLRSHAPRGEKDKEQRADAKRLEVAMRQRTSLPPLHAKCLQELTTP